MSNHQQTCDRCGVTILHSMGRRIWFCNDCKDKSEICFEGILVKIDTGSTIKPGDIYLAKRNTGWKLLTCKENNLDKFFVVPEENAYWYDLDECFKVVCL